VTRKALVAAFVDANQDLIDQAGGRDQEQGHAAFDAINERYANARDGAHCGGRKRATTLRQAVTLACYRVGSRWTLDLDTLNETAPAVAVGGFRPAYEATGDSWAQDAEVSAVAEIRDELQRLRDAVAVLNGRWPSGTAENVDLEIPIEVDESECWEIDLDATDWAGVPARRAA